MSSCKTKPKRVTTLGRYSFHLRPHQLVCADLKCELKKEKVLKSSYKYLSYNINVMNDVKIEIF